VSSDPILQVALANDRVQWHFISPAAPHFGGLWEAGVKSFKFHLRRVVGSRTLSGRCPSRSRCTLSSHACRRHHSLLHLAAATVQTPADREIEIDDLSRTVSTATSTTVANVQNAQAEVASVQVLLATAWVDLHIPEGRRFKALEPYLIRDRPLALFPSLFVRFCERNVNAPSFKYAVWRQLHRPC